jgi:hypothetical protein
METCYKVFTKEVLERIDKHIYPMFNYNVDELEMDIEEILEENGSND